MPNREAHIKPCYMLETPKAQSATYAKISGDEDNTEMGNQQRSLENDLNWLGGIIDGEGMVTAISRSERNRKNKAYIPRISVVNTNQTMINECLKIFENVNISIYIQTKKGKGTWKTKIEIIISGYKRVHKALPILIPYIRTKKRQAELLYELCISRLQKKSRESYSEYEFKLGNQIRDLNRNGSLILPETTRKASNHYVDDDIVRPFVKA